MWRVASLVAFQARSTLDGWSDELVWFHNVADLLIWLAFLAIPLVLIFFVRQRRDVPFHWVFWMFSAFIIAGGFTHFMNVVTTYYPLSLLAGTMKVVTAVIAWATVVALIPVVPKALAFRSPAELEQVNSALKKEIAERSKVEESLRSVQENLEKLVKERTWDLSLAVAELRQEVREREKAEHGLQDREERLLSSLNEKEMLLREVHHRVKNNLQVITSLLGLQARYVKDPESAALFNESENRVRCMAALHETLYRSEDLGKIDFAAYVQTLAADLSRLYAERSRNLRLKCNVQKLSLNMDTAIPCGLILHELVSNCFKHAYPGHAPGEVTVEVARSQDEQITLTVRDHGVGLPKDLDIATASSLGLRLVRALTLQLGAVFEFQKENPGTLAKLTFANHETPEGG